jgi:Holliday junction resolvase RusA-like endonuclease
MYDPGTAEGWKGCIAMAAETHCPAVPLDGPVSVSIDFLFQRPGRLLRKKDPDGRIPHVAKPDRDNCEKAVLDALTQLGFWRDDAQVCAGEVRKYYCARDEPAGAIITISDEGFSDLLL